MFPAFIHYVGKHVSSVYSLGRGTFSSVYSLGRETCLKRLFIR